MSINIENYEIWFLDFAEGNLDDHQVQALYAFLENHPELKSELDEFEIFQVNKPETNFMDKDSLKQKPVFTTDDFIAYHEGDLTSEVMSEVDAYLTENSVAKKEFDQLAVVYLSPSKDEKISLQSKVALKSDWIGLGKDVFIAFHEGDLNEETKDKVLTLLKKDPDAKKEFDSVAKLYLTADKAIVFPNKAALKKKETLIIPMFLRYAAVAASLLLLISLFFFNDKQVYHPRENLAEIDFDQDPINAYSEDTLNLPYKLNQNSMANNQLVEDNPLVTPGTKNIIKPRKNPTTRPDVHFSDHAVAQNTTSDNENKNVVVLSTLPLKKLGIPSNSLANYSQLEGEVDLANYKIPTDEDFANESSLDEDEQNTNNTEAITLLAFVEQKAAQAVTGKKKKRLKLFDVVKKVGESSKLYDLSEKDQDGYNLKVLNIEVEGKRKRNWL